MSNNCDGQISSDNCCFNGSFGQTAFIDTKIVNGTKNIEAKLKSLKNLIQHKNVQQMLSYEQIGENFQITFRVYDITLEKVYSSQETTKDYEFINEINFIKSIVEGLEFLHDNKIFHGNICPKNIGVDKTNKFAVLCNFVYDAFDEETFIAPEVLEKKISSYEGDIFSLGCVIHHIMTRGGYPFGSTNNRDAMSFSNHPKINKDIKKIKLQYKNECANFLQIKLLSILPAGRLNCSEILEYPLFWNSCEKYNFFKRIGKEWNLLEDQYKELIETNWKNELLRLSISKYDTPLLTIITTISKEMKYYDDDLMTDQFSKNHLNYFLNQYQSLLPIAYDINCKISKIKREHVKEKSLSDIWQENNLPKEFLIQSHLVTFEETLNESNSLVFTGSYRNDKIVIKKIPKIKFRIEEVTHNLELTQRSQTECSNCKRLNCENIIKCYGCFEDGKDICIIFEKADMDFKSYCMKYSKMLSMEDEIRKIYHDATKGLGCLHSHGIAHLDIKSSNIMVVDRNGVKIGCIADLGESVKKYKGTLQNIRFKGSEGYTSMEYSYAVKQMIEETYIEVNFLKCDIFSMGKVLFNSLGLKCNIYETLPESLAKNRKNKKISYLCKELINYMTGNDHTERPDADGVYKNPYFWDAQTNMNFLRDVMTTVNEHQFDTIKRNSISKEAELIIFRNLPQKCWVSMLSNVPDVHKEVLDFISQRNHQHLSDPRAKFIDKESIFGLIDIILSIYDTNNEERFLCTRQITKIDQLQHYLNFWFKKYQIIPFLYYTLRKELKVKHGKYYSLDAPQRNIVKRKLVISRANTKLCKKKKKE